MKLVEITLSESTFKNERLIEELKQHKQETRVRLSLGSADIRWGDCSKIAAIVEGHTLCRGEEQDGVILFLTLEQLCHSVCRATVSGQREWLP